MAGADEKCCGGGIWRRCRGKEAASGDRDESGPSPTWQSSLWNQSTKARDVVCVQRSSVALLTSPGGKGGPQQFKRHKKGLGRQQRERKEQNLTQLGTSSNGGQGRIWGLLDQFKNEALRSALGGGWLRDRKGTVVGRGTEIAGENMKEGRKQTRPSQGCLNVLYLHII